MGRHKLDRCKRGHDTTAPDARYANNGQCRRCHKDWQEARRRASGAKPRPRALGKTKTQPREHEPRVDPAPLFAYIATRRMQWAEKFTETDQRLLYRWRRMETVPMMRMDEFICHELGVHPVAVYGADWYMAGEEEAV